MSFGGPTFVITIIAICMGAWVITTFIRAKHGYPLTDDWGNAVHPVAKDDVATKALVDENKQLKANVERLEERLKVLERIATDPTRRLADEIDNLR
jgi:cell division protein FtsB